MVPECFPKGRCSPRFSLGSFLLLASIAGPCLALLYWSCFADQIWSNSIAVETGNPQVPRAVINAIFSHSRFAGQKDELIAIVVRPGPNTIPIDETGSSSEEPRMEGISVRGGVVFVHGERVTPKHMPCFLVYQPQTRNLLEIAIDPAHRFATEPRSIVAIPEWQSRVVPALTSSEPASESPG